MKKSMCWTCCIILFQIQGETATTAAASVRSSGSVPFSSSLPLGAIASRSHRVATSSSAAAAPKGLLGTVKSITKNEGVRALYSGLAPGLQRQMCFASVRIGLYDAVKHGYTTFLKADPNQKNIHVRLLAGITTGGAAVLVAQPTDVVKVRMQAQGNKPGHAKRYSSCIQAYRTIAMKEGARGLWKGTFPNVSRNAIVNCTELVSYELIKEALLGRQLLADNIVCHFVSAVGAGFFTTLFASPVDVLKTRYMNASEGVAYKGIVDCAVKMYKEAGIRTFYKGAVPAFLRFGPWNVVMFISYEQLKKQFGSRENVNNNSTSSKHSTCKIIPSLEIKQQQNSSRFM